MAYEDQKQYKLQQVTNAIHCQCLKIRSNALYFLRSMV